MPTACFNNGPYEATEDSFLHPATATLRMGGVVLEVVSEPFVSEPIGRGGF